MDGIPEDYEGMTLVEAVAALMYNNDRPFWVRRSKDKQRPWEVCYHEKRGAVTPVVVERFYDHGDATQRAAELVAELFRRLP